MQGGPDRREKIDDTDQDSGKGRNPYAPNLQVQAGKYFLRMRISFHISLTIAPLIYIKL